MALYNETDDWQRFAREQMQNSAQNLQQKQAGLDAAKNQKTKTTLESALSGLVNGLKERGSDILNTVKNIEKTKYGWLNQIGANKSIENAQKDDSARRNEIAKKYGFNSYSEAINSDKVGDNFWNEIKANNEQTKQNLKANTDAYRNNITDVTKVNTNEAKGQALNTIDSVLSLIPGAGGVAANVAGGAIAGVGDEYKRVGREGGDFNLDNALKNAAVGGASGLAGSAGSAGLGKVATKFGGNAVGKALSSNLASGVAGGASAGAIGGALGTALNGGTLEDALLAAKEGAKAGGIGGGVMAGTMGLGGTALEKLRNRGTTAQAIEPVDAQIVQKNRIEAPTAERIPSTVEAVEPVSNKRGIAITDLDAGEQPVNVRNGRPTESRGKYIDSVVRRSDANLPEAQRPAHTRVAEPIIDTDGNFFVNDGIERIKTINGKTTTYTGDGDWNGATVYSQDGRGLPDGYKLMFDENAAPANNYVAIENPNGSKALIELPQASEYDYERVGMATGRDREGLMDSGLIAPEGGFRGAGTPRKIDIESALTNTQDVPVENLATNYRKSTIPARQYNEQAIQTMPEAEIATRPTTAQVAPEPETTAVATGWGGKNMEGASKKSNILQKAGKTLQETGQATKDNQVYSKLKGDFAEEMARKQSVERLRELGYSPSEYKKAANASEVINKFYDDSIKATKTPVEAPQIRNIAREVADDLHISSANRADLEKLVNGMLDDAVAKDGKMTGLTMDRYTPADLEKVAKNLGQKAENITTTNYGGRKKNINNLTPENAEYARALGEVRNRLRNEIGEMADYNEPELIARMKNAGMTQKQIDYVTQDHTLRGIKSRTSLFEDARNMDQQMRSDSLKRGANSSNSTNIATQIANESGASGLVKTIAQIPAQAIGTAEKAVGKALSWAGDKVAGIPTENAGETAGKLANGAKNLAGKVAGIANNATASLNNDYLAGINGIRTRNGNTIEFNALGNQAQQFANKQMGKAEAERSQNRLENAQAVANAQNEYDNALADYNAQEANYNANMAQAQNQATGASQLDRIAVAMEMALNAGDITAYGQLADLYKQAYNIYEMQNPQTKNEGKALSANQAKALTAQQQLDALAQMTPNAGTVASGIPLLGNIVNLTGGNEYANQASSLATTLGYLLSGANIKESEAQRIGQAYVPTAFDSEAVRQQKLERARQLIQSYMSDTGALEA